MNQMFHYVQLMELSRKRMKALERVISSRDYKYFSDQEARNFIGILVEMSVYEKWRPIIQKVCDDLYATHGEKVLHRVQPNELKPNMEATNDLKQGFDEKVEFKGAAIPVAQEMPA